MNWPGFRFVDTNNAAEGGSEVSSKTPLSLPVLGRHPGRPVSQDDRRGPKGDTRRADRIDKLWMDLAVYRSQENRGPGCTR
jgi:hypothetical protein